MLKIKYNKNKDNADQIKHCTVIEVGVRHWGAGIMFCFVLSGER